MATQVVQKGIRALEGETKSLSTAAGYIAVKPGFDKVKLYCASAWRLALSPALLHAVYYNGTTYSEYKGNVTDRVTTTHMPLDGMTTSHLVYLGFSEPALGVYIDVDTNVNAETATLDVEYCTTAVGLGATIAFTDVSGDSDGTTNGGATLAQDGVYTWTLPTDWVHSTLGTHALPLFTDCWWIRFKPSATLSATIDVAEIIPVYQNTSYAYMEAGIEYPIPLPSSVGGLVVSSVAGTPTLNVSWGKQGG